MSQKNPKWKAGDVLDEVYSHMVKALMARPAGAVVRVPKKPSVHTVRRYGPHFEALWSDFD